MWVISPMATAEPDYDHMKSQLEAFEKELNIYLPEDFLTWEADRSLQWLNQELEKTSDGSLRYYMTYREIFRIQFYKSNREKGSEICTSIARPKPFDIKYRYWCTESLESKISNKQAIQQHRATFRDAVAMDRHDLAIELMMAIGWLQSLEGDIAEALASFLKVQEMVPKEDTFQLINVEFNLATLYIVHGDDEYVGKGIEILENIRTLSKERLKSAPGPEAKSEYDDIAKLASFNIGIAYTLHLYDYQRGYENFMKSALKPEYQLGSWSFAALAASELGRYEDSKALLKKLESLLSISKVKGGYHACYQALARHNWDPETSLKSCFELHPNTTIEVLTDINKRLVKLKGEAEELSALRQFVQMYEEKIEPEFRKRTARAASNNELRRLEIESLLKDEKIRSGETIQNLLYLVSGAFVLLLAALFYIIRANRFIKIQSADITQQKKDLQHVLDHIDEGIVVIDRAARIKPVYSKYSRELIADRLESFTLEQLFEKLGLGNDDTSRCREVMRSVLGEETFSWEVNALQLPDQILLNDQPLFLYWTPIIENSHVEEVIMSVRDASESLRLQQETEDKERLLTVIQAESVGYDFLEHMKQQINELKSFSFDQSFQHVLRLAHTAKGEARSLRFKRLVDYLHDSEQALLCHDLESLRKIGSKLLEEIAKYRAAYHLIWASKPENRSQKSIFPILQNFFVDAEERLKEAGYTLQSKITYEWFSLSDKEWDAVNKILSHGISNSVDHGFIFSSQIGEDVKLAEIEVRLWTEGDRAFLELSDRGGGIHWQALERKAENLGLQSPSREELTRLILSDQTTSMEAATLTSGRGVGLAVVAEAANALDARLSFTDREDSQPGSVLRVSWNRDYILKQAG